MPFTYLSHQAPVVALKAWQPARLDGAALVFGSMSPDWAYVLNGTRWSFDGHKWPGMVWFSVPVSFLVALLWRRSEPALLGLLPWRPAFVRDLEVRRPPPRALWVLLACAVIGVATHVGWDLFTHDFRWGPRHIAWLRARMTIDGHTASRAHWLQNISTVGGAIFTLVFLNVAGRHHWVRDWRPEQRSRFVPSDRARVVVGLGVVLAAIGGIVWAASNAADGAAAVNRVAVTIGITYYVFAVIAHRRTKES